jgi:hypothetical protein
MPGGLGDIDMKTHLLTVIALALALAAGILWQRDHRTVKILRAENAALAEQAALLKLASEQSRGAKIDQAEVDRLRSLQSEVNKLRAQVSNGQNAESQAARLRTELSLRQNNNPQAGIAGLGTNALGAMHDMMQGMAMENSRSRLLRMKDKLKLTTEQEEAIAKIMGRQAEENTAMTQKVLSGSMTKQEMNAMAKNHVNPEKEIRALLNPEQQAAYKEFTEEEKTANVRLAANAELMQMQTSLGLSADQQDQVFNVLSQQLEKGLAGTLANQQSSPTSASDVLQQQFDQKAKALEPVLTPTQMETYRKFQQTQLKMIKSFMPDFSGAESDGIAVPK